MLVFKRIKYKIKVWFYRTRAKFVIWLVKDIPVMINCTTYDDVLDFNFGPLSRGIAFNNKVKPFRETALKFAKEETSLAEKGITRSKNGAFVLTSL